jgi:hypothetical protein
MDQAKNYDANMHANNGSLVMGGNSYRGLVFIFENATAADAAARGMNAETGANGARGLNANLKVGYFGTTGTIVWLR